MCLIKVRSDPEEDVVVASRPVATSRNGPSHLTPLTSSHPRLSIQQNRTPRTSQVLAPPPPQQLIIIEQAPRRSTLSVHHGEDDRFRSSVGRLSVSGAPGGAHRRSSSLGFGIDPRQSNASYRSTREKIVVVDERGIRREYYR